MKNLNRYLAAAILVLVAFVCQNARAQEEKTLLQEGVKLHDQGKYAEAIAKYEAALKLNPHFLQAEFEMSYSLYSSGKGEEAIPHLRKVIDSKDDTDLAAQASDILGSIYDDGSQPNKAIEAYQAGINLNPKYQRLHYNLALCYLRQKKYPEAEAAVIEAIKLEPKHASSQQLYAAALQSQNKNACALLAYCSFLMLEPQTKRSAAAYQQIQAIIDSKYNVAGDRSVNVFLPDGKDANNGYSTLETAVSLSAAQAASTNAGQSKTDVLEQQLKSIFGVAGQLSQKRAKKDFFWVFYVDYLYKLAQTDNMPAFTRLVNLTANQDENVKWFKDNPDKLNALDTWVKKTERAF